MPPLPLLPPVTLPPPAANCKACENALLNPAAAFDIVAAVADAEADDDEEEEGGAHVATATHEGTGGGAVGADTAESAGLGTC